MSGKAGSRRWTRRRVLALGFGTAAAVAAAGSAGVELVSRGVLPGKAELVALMIDIGLGDRSVPGTVQKLVELDILLLSHLFVEYHHILEHVP